MVTLIIIALPDGSDEFPEVYASAKKKKIIKNKKIIFVLKHLFWSSDTRVQNCKDMK